MTECFECGLKTKYTQGLLKLRSQELDEANSNLVEGKIDATYKTDDRWISLDCLSGRIEE